VDRVLAIAWLRYRLVTRKLRGPGGTLNAIAVALLGVLGVGFAIASAVGLTLLVHVFVNSGDVAKIRVGFMIVAYLCFFVGVLLPLLRGAMDQGFDASPFVIFPISRMRLYGVTLVAAALGSDHLLYYSILVGVTITGVLLPGVAPIAGVALVGMLALFFVTWGNVVTLLLVSVMRARRVREIAAIVALLIVISASFAPMMLDDSDREIHISKASFEAAASRTMAALSVLPPSIAAEGLTALHVDGGGFAAWRALSWLALWNFAGLVLGYRVFSRRHLGEGGVRTAARRTRRRAGPLDRLLSFDGPLFASFPLEVRAVASKDLRYLLRSVVGRFVLFMTPVFVFAMSFLLGRGLDEPLFGLEPRRILLFIMLLYTALFSNNFLYNSFAWEGDGVKSYYLCPVPLRSVLLGKNLAVWLYNGMLFALVLVTFSVAKGPPDLLTLASAVFLYTAPLLVFTSFGNILSIRFPTPRDMSTTRNSPAPIAILLSIVVLVVTGLLLGPFLSIPMLLGLHALQPVLLAGVCAATTGLYRMTLRHATQLLDQRRDQMIDSLKTVR